MPIRSMRGNYCQNRKNNMMKFRSLTIKWWLCLLACAFSISLKAQEKPQLTGIVTSEKGEILIGVGVSIVAAGTTEKQNLSTNEKGVFTVSGLKPGNKYQFTFSFMGYEKYVIKDFVIKAGANNSLIIRMKEAPADLNEVVVIGYGSVLKKDLTGAISTIKSEKITEVAVTNVTQALQGRVAGVMAQTTSWKPGTATQVRIRGARSINASNEVLYVVDGMPLTDGADQINPNDIETINVLKDASATAIYGNRGANGVIIITTKKGKVGMTTVEYNGYYGVQKNRPMPELMNAAEFVEYSREAQRNTLGGAYDPKPSRDLDFKNDQLVATPYMLKNMENAWASGTYDPSKLVSTDWMSLGLRTGSMQDHQLSVRGGTEKTKLLLSVDYFNNVGVVKDQDYTRYSIRANIDHSIRDNIKIGTQSLFTSSQLNAGWNEIFDTYGLKSFNPIASPYGADGKTLALYPTNNTRTPNPLTNFGNTKRLVKQDRYIGNYYLDVSFLNGFNLRSNVGLDYRGTQNLNFNKANTASAGGEAPSSTSNGGNKKLMYSWENILSYNKSIGDHNLYATLVQSIQSETTESYGVSVRDLPYDQQLYYNVGSALTISGVSSGYSRSTLASFMGRLNYNYKNKYLATVSTRYDGSSVLAVGHKWVAFPSVALAWRLKGENFLKDVKAITDLKLRLGWGRTGNSGGVSPYITWGSLSTVRYVYGETSKLGFAPTDMINPNLGWETTGQYNIGLDFSLLRGRISGSIEAYQQNTSDLLLDQQLPTVSGFDKILVNIGKTTNKGFEVTINTVNVSTRKLKWSTDWIFATNKQRIVELYNGKNDDLASGWFIGQPVKVAYDLKPNGIWQDTDADKAEMAKFAVNGAVYKPGDVRPLDLNHDYKIDAADRSIFGQADPKWTASLGNNIQYGNFDASVFIYANVGQTIYHDLDMRFDGRYNQPKLDYWTPNNPSKTYPRPFLGSAGLSYLSILNYYDGSFLRVKNISLGYTLPAPLVQKAHLQKFRIYGSVQNPFVVTKFPGTDPEGATGFKEPSLTMYLVGVNVGF